MSGFTNVDPRSIRNSAVVHVEKTAASTYYKLLWTVSRLQYRNTVYCSCDSRMSLNALPPASCSTKCNNRFINKASVQNIILITNGPCGYLCVAYGFISSYRRQTLQLYNDDITPLYLHTSFKNFSYHFLRSLSTATFSKRAVEIH